MVNAGVSGANAAAYGRLMQGLDLSLAHAMFMTIGTNDLLGKPSATPGRSRRRRRMSLFWSSGHTANPGDVAARHAD